MITENQTQQSYVVEARTVSGWKGYRWYKTEAAALGCLRRVNNACTYRVTHGGSVIAMRAPAVGDDCGPQS